MAGRNVFYIIAAGILASLLGGGINRTNYRPLRQEPARSSSVLPEYELETKDTDPDSVDLLIDALEKVPDRIQYAVNKRGGKVVLFEGDIHDTETVSRLEELTCEKISCDAMNIDEARGVYVYAAKKAMIKQGSDGFQRVALHEYGHMVDHLFSRLSSTYEFQNIYLDSLVLHHRSFRKNQNRLYGMRTSKEFFAECFAEFHYSSATRQELEIDFPEAYRYLADLERNLATEEVRQE